MAINNAEVKKEIQKLLHNNTARAGGDFHSDELDEFSFIDDLIKHCKITPIDSCENITDKLERVIKLSTVKVRGMISSRELKQSKFFRELFNSFEIEMI